MKGKLLFLLCLIIIISTVSFASAADDINQTIGNGADTGTFSQLEEKISNAQNASIVELDKDYIYDGETNGYGINITKDITINGNGHKIDANHASRIFYIDCADVVLNNIVFVNALTSDGGGAVYSNYYDDSFNNTRNLEITNCSFINNSANVGGAIYCSFVDLKVNNSTFINNSASQPGEVYILDSHTHGGAIYLIDSDAFIDNSIFLNNSADNGAAICHHAFFGRNDIVISNSVLNDNAAKVDFGIRKIYGQNYTYGDVYLTSRDPLADHQMDITPPSEAWFQPYPYLTFINVSYNEFKNQSFTFEVRDLNYNLDNETVRFEVYGDDVLLINTTNVTDNGISRIDYGNLTVGDYYLLKVFYKNLTDTATIIAKKDPNFTMSVDDIRLGDDLVINFDISSEIEGNGTCTIWYIDSYVDLPDYHFKFNLKDKNITMLFPSLGNYGVILEFDGDDTFYSRDIRQQFTVYPADYNMTGNRTILNVNSVVKTFGGNERLYVNLTDINSNPLKNKEILIKINGVTYRRTTNDKGQTSMAINLNPGQYYAMVLFEGDEQYCQNANVSYLGIDSSIICDDYMSKFCRDSQQFQAQFFDSEDNPLTGGQALFNINGVLYRRNIDLEGYARLNINLNQGEYVITSTNPVTGEMKSSIIDIKPTIIENYDLTKYYRNDSQFTVTLDGDGDLNNQIVTFNINGVMYERKTNDDGVAKLNINLQPGEYVITSMYNGCAVSNKITVLPVLTAEDMNMTYLDGSTFNATLVDGTGNPLSNVKITFNINGVFYDRTTDENGTARLNIRLIAGEYIITSIYDTAVTANMITIV
ncbi:hypothetical protein [Methanobrevibacter sp.]|uniref:Ig-like domain-containing protein n=1 Tax=Methanobrevibacter sp. TaxID=66852 RepID=UPI00388D8E7E